MTLFPKHTRQLSQYYKETNVTANKISMMPLLHLFNAPIKNKYRLKKKYWPTHLIMQKPKEKKGHTCTNKKKRYASWSNCYNPQLNESGWTVISAHDLISLFNLFFFVNCHYNLFMGGVLSTVIFTSWFYEDDQNNFSYVYIYWS